MKLRHIFLVVVIFFVLTSPVWLLAADAPLTDYQSNAEDVESYPGPDTPWYAVGFMPVLLIGGSLAVLLAVLAWAVNITRMRRFGREQ